MTMWTMLTIRELDDDGPTDLFPRPGREPNTVVSETGDGTFAPTVTAVAVRVDIVIPGEPKPEKLLEANEIKASLYISDSRVALACTKYDKGGGWIGGAGALAINGVSKVRAAVRRSGKCLVGQVRYPWILSVGYIEKTGWKSDEMLRVAVDVGGEVFRLDLTLPKDTSAKAVAREITRRAARHRRAESALSAEQREAIESLLDPPELAVEKGSFSMWRFPFSHRPGAEVEYGAPGGNDGPTPAAPSAVASPSADSASTAPPRAEPVSGDAWWRDRDGSTSTPLEGAELEPTERPAAKWADDPFDRHQLRYWNGQAWTRHVSNAGVVSIDPPTRSGR